MASPAEMSTLPPETLPADFSEWDSEASSKLAPVSQQQTPVAAQFVDTNPKTPAQSPARAEISIPAEVLPPLVGKFRASGSAAPAAVTAPAAASPSAAASANQQKSSTISTNREWPSRAARPPGSIPAMDKAPAVPKRAAPADVMHRSSEHSAPSTPKTDKDFRQSFLKTAASAEKKRIWERPGLKKWRFVAPAAACSILLSLVLLQHFHPGAAAVVGAKTVAGETTVARQPVGSLPATLGAKLQTEIPQKSALDPSNHVAPPATTPKQQTADRRPLSESKPADSKRAQARIMHDQVTAPRRILQDANGPVTVEEPPFANLGAASLDGLRGSGVSSGMFPRRGPFVMAPPPAPSKPLAISSGVALGMLIDKTPPVYPPIAKSNRISGTVQLQAIISKSGEIKDLHIVNGPPILQQAAVEAVRAWRYKPYKLDNQPVEVETTINVVFALQK